MDTNSEAFRKMAQSNMRMTDIKSRIQKEAARELLMRKGTHAFRCEAKLASILSRKNPVSALVPTTFRHKYSGYLSPLPVMDPTSQVTKPKVSEFRIDELEAQMERQAQESRKRPPKHDQILDRMRGKIAHDKHHGEGLGNGAVEFFEQNPSKLQEYIDIVRKKKDEQFRRRRELHPRQRHKHIYSLEQKLTAHRANSVHFPKNILEASRLDVVKSSQGASVGLVDEDVRPAQDLADIIQPAKRLSVVGNSSVLGASLLVDNASLAQQLGSPGPQNVQSIVLANGTTLEFDQTTVSSLTINGCALLVEVAAALDLHVGKLAPIARGTAPLELAFQQQQRAHSTTPPPSPEATRVRQRRKTMTPQPKRTPQQITNDLTFEDVLQLQALEEALFPKEIGAAPRSRSPTGRLRESPTLLITNGPEDDGTAKDGAPEEDATVPMGPYMALVEDVDSYAATSSSSEYEPLCIVCQSKRHIAPPAHHKESSRVATSSLQHWKALLVCSKMDTANSLSGQLSRRKELRKAVTKSTKYLATITQKATSHGEMWHKSRDLTMIDPTDKVTVWLGASSTMDTENRNMQQCELFWRRLQHMLGLLGMPCTSDQLSAVNQLRTTILKFKQLHRCMFFHWLLLVGPKVTDTRDLHRLSAFIRVELGVPHAALVKWTRMPAQRSEGWHIAEEN